jgi:pilus assembly protein CpaC
LDLQLNLFNGKFNQQTSLGTGGALFPDDSGRFPVPSPVNLLLLRPDIGLAAEIQALQAKRVLEILAEPNLLTISGQEAKFLAGGEFPFPVVQPGQSGSAISIMWREYGIRLGFLPVVTPRGTIRLKVAPEVSSLDYTNAVTIQGATVPGISTRRLQTEVELESGQTFVIAGLLDRSVRDNFSKVPGIGDIPVLGKLFQSKSIARSNSELLVIITPEVVRPIPVGQPVPELQYPLPLITKKEPAPANVVHPGMDKTGPVPVKSAQETLPVEQLMPKKEAQAPQMYQMIPLLPAQQPPPPGAPGSASAPAPAGGGN